MRELRGQFGNLGFAAAAYNAGPRRVSAWLTRHRTLPRETRGYVMNITGRSVEQWRKTPPQDDALHFVRQLPCRDLPAFAQLEREQRPLADLQGAEQSSPPAHIGSGPHKRIRRGHLAHSRHPHTRLRPEKVRTARHMHRPRIHEAGASPMHADHRGKSGA